MSEKKCGTPRLRSDFAWCVEAMGEIGGAFRWRVLTLRPSVISSETVITWVTDRPSIGYRGRSVG
jgi:hypothetical protein